MPARPFKDGQHDDGLLDAEPWPGYPFSPESAPPDGDEAFLADLPAELAQEHLSLPWNGAREALGAGFLHRGQGRRGTGFAAGGVLDQLEPGPVLAGFVRDAAEDGAGLPGLGESELIGFLCAAERMASWAAAQKAEAVITLCRRRAAQARKRKSKHLIEHVAGEVAAALTLTGRAASRLVDICGCLERLPQVRAALAAGIIDWPRAVVFADELAALAAAARRAAGRVLPRAGEMTTAQLRRALRREAELADPEAASRRRQQGRKDAAVHRWEEASGNSALAGREMRLADAISADARLTAQARWLQARGAAGTLDQLRGQAFAAVLNGRDLATLLPPQPGDLTGHDDPATAGPGGLSPADGQPDSASSAGLSPAGPAASSASATSSTSSTSATSSTAGGAGPGGPSITGSVHLTMPLSAWLHLTDRPGEVAGSGTLLETGTCTHQRESPAYRPPRSLRHLITIRQRTCAEPGCQRPAHRADLDHTIAYHQGGKTCECNIAPLCRHGHRAKQAPGWHLDQPEPGVMTWTLPSGRQYTTRPDPYPI